MPALIAFKRFGTVGEIPALHPTLRAILEDTLEQWPSPFMVVTRIYDPPVTGESGVHRTRPHRAADLRTNTLTFEIGEEIEQLINKRWQYDDDDAKQVALQHGEGANRHIHLQVTVGTRRRA